MLSSVMLLALLAGIMLCAVFGRGRRQRAYRKKLQDPRWAMRKLQYYSRHEKRCARCRTTKKVQLNHLYYRPGAEPWEYPDSAFLPLCRYHHCRYHHIRER